jgi:hypothetical protein
MTTWRSSAVAFAAAATVLSGCGQHHEEHGTGARAPQRVATNPSTFPLFRPSEIIAVKALDSGPMVAAFRKNDPHDRSENYRGSEVVFATGASLAELRAWLRKLEAASPQGLRYSHGDTIASSDPEAMRANGAVGASFQSPHGDRVVVVFAVDPRLLHEKLGSALDLVDKYDKVPGMLRGPLDDSMKQQIGYSISEMLDANSPVGVAFRGLKTAEARNRRAIVLIDERRVPE